MVYDIDGNTISTVYDIEATLLEQCYDIDGNELIDTPSPSRYRTFSVLADSYGAISGGVTPSTNAVYYPANDVTEVSQMWWAIFEQKYGAELIVNNSFSGSRVANDASWFQGIEQCYIARSENIGQPDLILILGGTNDIWNSIPLGEYIYTNWDDDDKATFRGALSFLLYSLKESHPDSRIIFLVNTIALHSNPNQWDTSYYDSVHAVCDHYSVTAVDIYPNYTSNHPTAHGMQQISNDLMFTLGETPSVVSDNSPNFTYPVTLDWNPADAQSTLGEITEGDLYSVSVTVTEVSADDVYVKSQIAGESATATLCHFDDHAGEIGTFTKYIEANSFISGNAPVLGVCVSTGSAKISNFEIKKVQF